MSCHETSTTTAKPELAEYGPLTQPTTRARCPRRQWRSRHHRSRGYYRVHRLAGLDVLPLATATDVVSESLAEVQITLGDVQLLGASAAGVMLADPRSELRLVAASSEAVRSLGISQLEGEAEPCLETIRTGQPVTEPDLSHAQQRWPRFTPAAQGRVSPRCTPFRCGCANRSSAVSTCSAASQAPSTPPASAPDERLYRR